MRLHRIHWITDYLLVNKPSAVKCENATSFELSLLCFKYILSVSYNQTNNTSHILRKNGELSPENAASGYIPQPAALG